MKGLPHKLFMQFRDHFLNSISYKLDDEEEFEKKSSTIILLKHMKKSQRD